MSGQLMCLSCEFNDHTECEEYIAFDVCCCGQVHDDSEDEDDDA